MQKLVAGGEPLHTGAFRCGDIADFVRIGDHNKVILDDVETLPVEHKTTLTLRADEMNAASI
jgi:hypothetical protein